MLNTKRILANISFDTAETDTVQKTYQATQIACGYFFKNCYPQKKVRHINSQVEQELAAMNDVQS